MKIVIGGAGAVGSHLAKLLATENHDITLVDEDEARLRAFSDDDISVCNGSPTSPKILREAGVMDADLFVAVTNYESRNINASIIAHNLGAKQTIARIDNDEYLSEENQTFLNQLGVNQLVLPEYLAAKEVVNSLENSWVRQWIDFDNGALILMGIKVRKGAPIVGQKLMDLKGSQNYRLVAIRREESTIIPRGQTQVLEGDVVYFITHKKYIPEVQQEAGKNLTKVRDLIIMGGSRIAVRVALACAEKGMNIKIFEKDIERANKISEATNGESILVLHADATNSNTLKAEDLSQVDAFVALTDNSEANMLTCMSARRSGVQKLITEIENTDYYPIAEKMDLGVIINKMEIAASYIYRLTLGSKVSSIKKLAFADAEIVEMTVSEKASIINTPVKDLDLPKNIFIGGLVRNGVGSIVSGLSVIEPGDKVILFCLQSSVQHIKKLLGE